LEKRIGVGFCLSWNMGLPTRTAGHIARLGGAKSALERFAPKAGDYVLCACVGDFEDRSFLESDGYLEFQSGGR
jgi:hypothetical protein